MSGEIPVFKGPNAKEISIGKVTRASFYRRKRSFGFGTFLVFENWDLAFPPEDHR